MFEKIPQEILIPLFIVTALVALWGGLLAYKGVAQRMVLNNELSKCMEDAITALDKEKCVMNAIEKNQ